LTAFGHRQVVEIVNLHIVGVIIVVVSRWASTIFIGSEITSRST